MSRFFIPMSNVTLWILWIALTTAVGTLLAFSVPTKESASEMSSVFLPGETTHGHYQIEMKCAACHEPGGSVREQSCRDCHTEELRVARDTHPESKFRDPTKAVLLEKIDARSCIACHTEHAPERTHDMGLTLPADYCFHCHQTIAEERPSHNGLSYDSCSTIGCHNFHDNTALYENFLMKHQAEPDILDSPLLPVRPDRSVSDSEVALRADEFDAFSSRAGDASLIEDWAESAHAASGVNCSGCHQPDPKKEWTDAVSHEACRRCHSSEVDGFLAGRHGMRLSLTLPPLKVRDARLPMRTSAAHRELTCSACHPAHNYDTRTASVDACLTCHDDSHSQAYTQSAHFGLWEAERKGDAPAGSGVSCASCHMPRGDDGRVLANHNQSFSLRPREKMLRAVCLNCHGMQFSLDALADPQKQSTCYSGKPDPSVRSLEMARDWFTKKQRQRERRSSPADSSP